MSTGVDLSERKVVHDERVKERNRVQRLLIRPEMGALIGAVVIFVVFTIVAPPFRTPDALANVLDGVDSAFGRQEFERDGERGHKGDEGLPR